MNVLILAGGMGTRLYPLTWGRPKGIVPIANKPFMERMLSWLQSYGMTEVVLALNYLPQMISDQLGDGSTWGLKLDYLIEDEPLGSGGAIKNAQHLMGSETFLVLNGDVFTDLDLGQMIEFHRQRGAQMTISLAEVDDPSGFGVVEMAADGRLRRFVEKPPKEEAPSRYINAGAWLFEPEILDKMPERGKPFSIEREFWPLCLEQGVPMYGYPGNCYWLDIGTVERYKEAHRDLLAGRVSTDIEEPETAPGIRVGAGAQVSCNAQLVPPVIIGAGAEIADGAQVSGSVVGAGCKIGPRAVLQESIIWEGAEIGADAEVLNSVVGARQKVAEGHILNDTALPDYGACAPKG